MMMDTQRYTLPPSKPAASLLSIQPTTHIRSRAICYYYGWVRKLWDFSLIIFLGALVRITGRKKIRYFGNTSVVLIQVALRWNCRFIHYKSPSRSVNTLFSRPLFYKMQFTMSSRIFDHEPQVPIHETLRHRKELKTRTGDWWGKLLCLYVPIYLPKRWARVQVMYVASAEDREENFIHLT